MVEQNTDNDNCDDEISETASSTIVMMELVSESNEEGVEYKLKCIGSCGDIKGSCFCIDGSFGFLDTAATAMLKSLPQTP
eukprot:7080175-Ditylum_brightwellii.AAC.1